MPKLTIDGKTSEVQAGQRLVLAIKEAGVPIGHRCGGKGECTSCRVEFTQGEPNLMTDAEFENTTEIYGLRDDVEERERRQKIV